MESISSLYVPEKLGLHYLDVLHNLLQLYDVIVFDCTNDLPEMERVAKVSSLESARLYFDDFGPDQLYALMFIEPPEEASEWIKHLPKHKFYWKMSRVEYNAFVQRYPRLFTTLENEPYCILPQLYISKYFVASKLFLADRTGRSDITAPREGDSLGLTEKVMMERLRGFSLDLTSESTVVFVNVTHHNAEVGDYAFPIHDAEEEDIAPVIHAVVEVYEREVIQAGKTMVIFCDKGQSRSGAVVLYLVCKYCKVGLEEARSLVYSVYPLISPNLGFIMQLEHLLQESEIL